MSATFFCVVEASRDSGIVSWSGWKLAKVSAKFSVGHTHRTNERVREGDKVSQRWLLRQTHLMDKKTGGG